MYTLALWIINYHRDNDTSILVMSTYNNFIELISNLVLVTETHVDDLDVINLNKFSYFGENRKQKGIRRSGDLAVLVKKKT